MEFTIFFPCHEKLQLCYVPVLLLASPFAAARVYKPKATKANVNIPKVFIKIRVLFLIPLPRSNLL